MNYITQDYFYYLEYSDYGLFLYCIITSFRPICPSTFFKCFMLNSGVHPESRTEPFIWTPGVDCSHSVNHDRGQVLNYLKYSLLVLRLLRLNLQPPDDFTRNTFQPYTLSTRINFWDLQTPSLYHILFITVKMRSIVRIF